MQKLPFFPLDIARWVQSEARTKMTLQQRGLYFELMALQWREGSIPTDQDQLKRAVSCTDEEFESAASVVMPHFNIRVGSFRRQNAVIEEVRARVLAKQQRLSEAGKKGGEKKAKAFALNKSYSQATSQANGQAIAGASHFPIRVLFSKAFSFENWFEVLYARHPRKGDKQLAQQYLGEVFRLEVVTPEEFERVHRLYCESEEWRWKNGAKAPKLADWVRDEGWKYPPAKEQREETERERLSRI